MRKIIEVGDAIAVYDSELSIVRIWGLEMDYYQNLIEDMAFDVSDDCIPSDDAMLDMINDR